MASEKGSWYVRTRGRTVGPFTWSQLESLRDRAQLARFHEVSQDRRSWVSAGTLSGLFVDTPVTHSGAEVYGTKNASPSAASTEVWFYGGSAGPTGPVGA